MLDSKIVFAEFLLFFIVGQSFRFQRRRISSWDDEEEDDDDKVSKVIVLFILQSVFVDRTNPLSFFVVVVFFFFFFYRQTADSNFTKKQVRSTRRAFINRVSTSCSGCGIV